MKRLLIFDDGSAVVLDTKDNNFVEINGKKAVTIVDATAENAEKYGIDPVVLQ